MHEREIKFLDVKFLYENISIHRFSGNIMKNSVTFISLILSIFALTFNACYDETKNNLFPENNGTSQGFTAGDTQTFVTSGVTFKMVYVPGGMTFPTGIDDAGMATVPDSYWIGETVVTYELWSAVYSWATTTISNKYTFANTGQKGNDGTAGKSNQHPVTEISWRDAMVWCNALTEWYNQMNGTCYTCAYTYANTIVRDATDDTSCDNAIAGPGNGFRLLSSDEFVLAARWRNDPTNTVAGYKQPYFTRGNSASGAKADYNDSTATGLVAVYADNSSLSTAVVKSKAPNALGLYDMSGNVWQWCFTVREHINDMRIARGGAWNNTSDLMQMGNWFNVVSFFGFNDTGFRLARTQ